MIKTIELAKIYENQGCFTQALEIYRAIAARGDDSDQVKDALERLNHMAQDPIHEPGPGSDRHEKKISALLEKWLRLMVLKQRLDNFKKIKSRLV
jgi:hypothetical protein